VLGPDHPGRPEISELWERAQPATIAGAEVLVLAPDDLLLHLCLHVAMHKFLVGLRPFCDIAQLALSSQVQLDWKEIAARSLKWRAGRRVNLTLALLERLLGVRVPVELSATIGQERIDSRLADGAEELILAMSCEDAVEQMPSAARDFFIGTRGPLRGWSVPKTLRRVLPDRPVLARAYSVRADSPLVWFYHLVRLKDGLLRCARFVWLLIVRDRETVSAKRRLENAGSIARWLEVG